MVSVFRILSEPHKIRRISTRPAKSQIPDHVPTYHGCSGYASSNFTLHSPHPGLLDVQLLLLHPEPMECRSLAGLPLAVLFRTRHLSSFLLSVLLRLLSLISVTPEVQCCTYTIYGVVYLVSTQSTEKIYPLISIVRIIPIMGLDSWVQHWRLKII